MTDDFSVYMFYMVYGLVIVPFFCSTILLKAYGNKEKFCFYYLVIVFFNMFALCFYLVSDYYDEKRLQKADNIVLFFFILGYSPFFWI